MGASSTSDTRLDEQANGQDLTVSVGESIELTLQETPTTGYRWNVVSSGAPVTELVQDQFQSPAIGAGQAGAHLWVFQVREPGHACIELHYARPWELVADPAKTFTLRVTSC
jgi:inhibitor of cysteine peptidase